jgi:hypothetical protein
MFKSIGALEKVILLAVDSSTPPAELVVAVVAAVEADVAVVEEEVVEAVRALQRHRRPAQMCRRQSMHMAQKSRLDGGNTIGRLRNSLLLMDTILANTHTPHPTLHGRILKI